MNRLHDQYFYQERRRRRQEHDLNQIFHIFETNARRIVIDYAFEMQKITDKGCSILMSLGQDHSVSFSNSDTQSEQSSHPQVKSLEKSIKKWSIYEKKQLHTIQEDSEMSFANPKLSNRFQYSQFKFDFKSPLPPTQNSQRISQQYELDLEKELSSCQKKQNQKNFVNLANPHKNLKSKNSFPQQNITFEQLIESTKKSFKKSLESLENEEQEQYPLTDYSSNQSSNEGSYRIYEIEQQLPSSQRVINTQTFSQDFRPKINFSKFKALKQNNIQITSSLKKKFKPTNIMNSPIKSKRLACRKKIIPRWAQNLAELSSSNHGKNPDQIFGKCVVQNLNLHFLFQNQHKQYQQRRSSALWYHDTSTL